MTAGQIYAASKRFENRAFMIRCRQSLYVEAEAERQAYRKSIEPIKPTSMFAQILLRGLMYAGIAAAGAALTKKASANTIEPSPTPKEPTL